MTQFVDTRTEREELADIISDTYKDINGVRPRHIDFVNSPIEELRAEAADLINLSNAFFDDEYVERIEQAEIELAMEHGAPDCETARRWLEEAFYDEL